MNVEYYTILIYYSTEYGGLDTREQIGSVVMKAMLGMAHGMQQIAGRIRLNLMMVAGRRLKVKVQRSVGSEE